MAELDEEYIARMEDVLAMYERPLSEQEPVVCMDEKPVVLHSDVRPPRPMRPGQVLRRDSEYKREGTANVFCGVQPKGGMHFTKATANRSSPEFADYLVEIVAAYPHAGGAPARGHLSDRVQAGHPLGRGARVVRAVAQLAVVVVAPAPERADRRPRAHVPEAGGNLRDRRLGR